MLESVFELPGVRPMSARSILASVLLGAHPPELPGRVLVAMGRLFGVSEGTVRVALSRMVAEGDLLARDGAYRLTRRLQNRQARQDESRHPAVLPWSGGWVTAIVVVPGREAAARAALREAMAELRMGELREGVWMRPDNLEPPSSQALALVAEQCHRFVARSIDVSDGDLAADLWDLAAWAATADEYRSAIERTDAALGDGEEPALAAGFVLSAAVLRLMLTDPLLPDGLAPARWPAQALRAEFEAFYVRFRGALRGWTERNR
jgi:phenylacetic acid degradation operon negative regulatory protein